MYKTLSVVIVAATLLAAGVAEAEVRTTTKGIGTGLVQGVTGTLLFSTRPGTPVVSFPIGCEASGTCLYSIFFEYVPAGTNPTLTDIFDRPPDPEDPLLQFDQCFAWVRRSPTLQPMRLPGVEHFLSGNPVPSDDSMLAGGGRHLHACQVPYALNPVSPILAARLSARISSS